MPTRSDIVDLNERLSSVEERLASIESSLRALAEAVGHPVQPAAHFPRTGLADTTCHKSIAVNGLAP